MKPYDDTSRHKAGTIVIQLNDEMGFTLEKIKPATWANIVDEKGNPTSVSSSGSLRITLDNFMEIAYWSPNWRF